MLSRRSVLAAGAAPGSALLVGSPASAAADEQVLHMADRAELTRSTPLSTVASIILAGCNKPGDGGGAQYRRVAVEPAHPGKIRAADGSWWELCEHRPTPDMFGADGSYDGDTAGLQACCDYVRANYVYANHGDSQDTRAGYNTTGAVYLNARAYRINRSIDFTDRGHKPGLAIVGAGKCASIISAKLTEPYAVLDMSGVPYARVTDMAVICERGDLSSCCLLLAQVVGTNLHNNVPLIDGCLFFSDYSPNLVTVVIMQACDLAVVQNSGMVSNLAPACSYGTGVPALYHGFAVGAGSTIHAVQLNVSGVYDNVPSRLGPGVVGKLLGLASGPSAQEFPVRRITGYDPQRHIVTLDAPLPAAPTDKTQLAILAVDSKFQTLSNVADNTSALFTGSNFTGTIGLVLRSQSSFTAIGCYFTTVSGGGPAPVVLDDYLFAHTPHSVQFIGGCRWENYVLDGEVFGFLTYCHTAYLAIEGLIAVDTRRGAQIAAALGGAIWNLSLHGEADGLTPLFRILDAEGRPGGIYTVEGIYNWNDLGVIASVQTWRLENVAQAGGMLDAIAAIAHSGSYQGVDLISRRTRIGATKVSVSPVLELQAFDVQYSATTGHSSQKRMTWVLPAGALKIVDPANRPRFHAEFAGSCNAAVSAFGVRLSQAATPAPRMGPLATGAMASGGWRLVMDIFRLGASWIWSGMLWSGTNVAASFQGALPAFDDGAPVAIEMFENAASGNAVDVLTSFAQIS